MLLRFVNGIMIFHFSFLAVEQMRIGATASEAAQKAIDRIAKYYPTFFGAVIAIDTKGNIGAACNGMEKFPFSVKNDSTEVPVKLYFHYC